VEKGTLVEFIQGVDRRLGLVDRSEGKKHWIVIDERGQSHTLHPREISYTVTGQTYGPPELAGFVRDLAPYLDPDALEVAWELLDGEGGADLPTLAQLLFSEQGPIACYATHCLLTEDRLYFKQRKDLYEPRPKAQVEEIKHQQLLAEQRRQEAADRIARIKAVIEADPADRPGLTPDWSPADLALFEGLARLATFRDEAKNTAAALELLQTLKRPGTPEGAFYLMVDLGQWSLHENLNLRRSLISAQFTSKVIDVAHSRLHNPPEDADPDRRDLTHLKAYTIDDESTREIDDGLSVEPLADGRHRLWIHIADPTRWISLGDELDLDARRRGTTVYLPERVISMFPIELATGPMSLVQGQPCCALSFGVTLTEAGAIDDYELCPSIIKPTYRLTYRDVDEMLELGVVEEPELAILHRAAQRRQQWRQSQGSITIRMPEASIKVSETDEISIDVIEESYSRQLVAEMMILTGEVAGRYGQTHSLPLPFRNQPQPELPSEAELLALPAGPVRDCAIRRCMPRSEVSLTPLRHSSLGLETYTQVTSPIRRYSDLIAHFQLKAHLRGDPLPFDGDDLKDLLQSLSSTSYEATLVERHTKQYWAFEYLRRQGEGPWTALMLRWLREHERLALVLIEDLGLEIPTRFDRSVGLGERMLLRVTHVDPRREVIQFQEVMEIVTEDLA
jgi:exoribonuclease II